MHPITPEDSSGKEETPEFRFAETSPSEPERDFGIGQMVSVSPEAMIQLAATVVKNSPQEIVLQLVHPSPTHPIREGDQVRIKYWNFEEASYFECPVLNVFGSGCDHMVVPKPRHEVVTQRRRVYRVHEPLPLSFTIIEAADTELVGKDFALKIRDLTVGGLAFETELSLQAGDRLDMNLELCPSQTVNALGSVIRSSPVKREGESLNSISMRFFQLEVEGQNQLLLFLAQCRPPE